MSASKSKNSTPTPAPAVGPGFDAASFEAEAVHSVYDAIASHFSATRHSPWPLVPQFLSSMPAGSLGADVGCGNGKYLRSAGQSVLIGVDRSANLVDLARTNTGDIPGVNQVAVGDALDTGLRRGAFDYAISIATIHHLSTPERRAESVRELIRLVKPLHGSRPPTSGEADEKTLGAPGRFLIFVWALEQRGESRRKFDEEADKAAGEAQTKEKAVEQDLLVPWVMQRNLPKRTEPEVAQPEAPVFQRYYHVFRSGELEALVSSAAADMPGIDVTPEATGWERGNWWGVWSVWERNTDAAAESGEQGARQRARRGYEEKLEQAKRSLKE